MLFDPKRGRASGVRVIDAQTMEEKEFTAKRCVSLRVGDRVGAPAAELEERSLSRRSRELERHARQIRDGSPLRLGRVGNGDRASPTSGRPGSRPNGIYIARFRNVKTQHPDFLRGYGMQGGSGRNGWGRGSSMPGYGAAFKQSLIDDLGPWSLSASGWGETLPNEANTHHARSDREGQVGHSRRAARRALARERARDGQGHETAMAEMLDAAGCTDIRTHGSNNPPGHCIHEMGGARMSRTPKDGVAEQVESGVGREEPVHDRRRVHGVQRVPESERSRTWR